MDAGGVHIVMSILDAQECNEALVHRFSHSPEATMDTNTIREKIHALKLDKSWGGTFLQHYKSQILLLESVMDDYALLWLEKTKMIILE